MSSNVTVEATALAKKRFYLPAGLIHKVLVQAVIFLAYFGIGCAFYSNVEGWTGVQSLYFLMVSASTVGYGDLNPSPGFSRLFTIIWILIGIICVFAQLSHFVAELFRPVFRAMRNMLERLTPVPGIDIDGDGTYDFVMPRRPLIYYSKSLIGPFTFIIIIQIIFASIFTIIETSWSFGDAFYHCIVTATTVGYGDVTILTESGRVFAFVHIVISVSLLAALIGDVGELAEERKSSLHKLSLLKGRLDLGLMKSLDRDGNGVDKFEFVIGMLLKLEIIDADDYEPFEKVFQQMDADGSGFLTQDDIDAAAGVARGGVTKDSKGRTIDLEALDRRLNGGGGSIIGEKTVKKSMSMFSARTQSITGVEISTTKNKTEDDEGSTPTTSNGDAVEQLGKRKNGWV